ncbi:XRE family transcriptional regulator [Bacillus subtilis]|nr:XRE family transcriptional regulator [Bacillus subtilis]
MFGGEIHLKVNEKLRAIRKSKGITQKFVANSLNIPIATYNGYELGRRKIHVELLKDIATVLDEPIQNFFEIKIYESKNNTA